MRQGDDIGIARTTGIAVGLSRPRFTSQRRRVFRDGTLVVPLIIGSTTRDAKLDALAIWREGIRPLTKQCGVDHPDISVDANVLGGIPHIAGTRLSVGQILGRLYVLGSVGDVVEYYRGRIAVGQVKEALAYAQDFIEAVCEPPEDNG
jgi:uncharacterized protein (DUF433 family)